MQFLLVNDSLIVPLDYLVPFPRYWRILLENSLFSLPSHPCLTLPSRGTLCNINVMYTSLKNIFSGLHNSVAGNTGLSSFCEITRNSEGILTYSSSRSSKVTDLGVNWKRICNIVINSNFGRISRLLLFSRYWRLKLEMACFCNGRRRFKISALCIGGQLLAAISSAAISEAANDSGHLVVATPFAGMLVASLHTNRGGSKRQKDPDIYASPSCFLSSS